MILTKHRDTFTLNMSSEDLIFLVNNLGSDPSSPEDQIKVVDVLKELTKFKEFAISFDQYMNEQIEKAEKYVDYEVN